jgi:hypothetical protein
MGIQLATKLGKNVLAKLSLQQVFVSAVSTILKYYAKLEDKNSLKHVEFVYLS